MGKHTRITFYLSDTGRKFHLPAIVWEADTEQSACRAGIMLDTRMNAASVSTTVAKIEENKHPGWICDNCARIAVNMEAYRQRREQGGVR